MGKRNVGPAAAGERHGPERKLTEPSLELVETLVTAIARVDVQEDQSRLHTGYDRNSRVWMSGPNLVDVTQVIGGIILSMHKPQRTVRERCFAAKAKWKDPPPQLTDVVGRPFGGRPISIITI
jgi:hypothetical protein